MAQQKGRHQKVGGLVDVGMAQDGKVSGIEHKRGAV